jgi:ribosome-associated protein
MQSRNTQKIVTAALADAKGLEVRVLDVRDSAGFTDLMVIASGTSSRHVQTLAEKVVEAMREAGRRPIGVEGQSRGDWVLIDFGEIVVHVMRPQTRDFYNLEKLWGEGKPAEPEKPKPRRKAAQAKRPAAKVAARPARKKARR